jgi:multidrug transporter EmrE-like cation transporter
MSSQFTRTLVAMAAALVMSTVAVSAAVAPIQIGTAYPLSNAIGATLNA